MRQITLNLWSKNKLNKKKMGIIGKYVKELTGNLSLVVLYPPMKFTLYFMFFWTTGSCGDKI